jgi:phosphatidylglycerol:prolipoprotein diacylglycerol transferase
MVALGFLAGILVAGREMKRKGMPSQLIYDLALYLLIGGLVVGRLVFVAFNLGFYLKNPLQILMFQNGGLAIHGSLLGGLAAGYLFSRGRKLSLGRLADAVAPALILGQAIGRIGCFLNGDSYGKITSMPWAVNFPGLEGFRHPTQLYEAGLNFVVFAVLWSLRKKEKFDGYLFLLYLVLYSIVRFVVEIFRESQILVSPLTVAQVASLAIIGGAVLIIMRKARVSAGSLK